MGFPKRISIEKFSASDRVLLYGLLALPTRARGGKTAVVHVHGLMSNFFGGAAVEELSRSITSKGAAFFSIQTRGSYIIEDFDRVRGRKRTSFFAGGALERFEDCVYDIDGAVRYLTSKGYRRIILEGHSTGCQKILYYHSKRRSSRVMGLVLLSPCDDYNYGRVGLGKRFGAAVAAARAAARQKNALMPAKYLPHYMMMGAARFLSTADPRKPESQILNYKASNMKYVSGIRVPALAVFGSDDMYLNVAGISAKSAADRLGESSRRIGTAVISGADHSFHGRRTRLANIVASWIEEVL